jgi:hypothetical protein
MLFQCILSELLKQLAILVCFFQMPQPSSVQIDRIRQLWSQNYGVLSEDFFPECAVLKIN